MIVVVAIVVGSIRFIHLKYLKARGDYKDAMALIESGETEEAVALLGEVLETDPDYRDAKERYYDLKLDLDPQSVLDKTEPLVQSDEATYEEQLLFVRALMRLDRHTDAIPMVKKFIEADSHEVEHLVLGGKIAFFAKDYNTAIKWLGAAYLKIPDDEEVRYYRALSLARGRSTTDKIIAKSELMDLARTGRRFAWESAMQVIEARYLVVFGGDLKKVFPALIEHSDYENRILELPLDSLRSVAKTMSPFHPEEAFKLMEVILESPEVTDSDKLEIINLGQSIGKGREIEPVLNQFIEDYPNDVTVLNFAAKQRIVTGNYDSGIALFSKILKEDPADQNVLTLLFALVSDTTSEMSIGQRVTVLKMLLDHPRSIFVQRLVAYDQLVEIRPTQRKDNIEKAIGEFRAEHLRELLVWLNQKKEYGRVLDLAPKEKAAQDPILFESRFFALIQKGLLKEANAELQKWDTQKHSLQRAYLNCIYFGALKDAEKARKYWQQAFKYAELENSARHFLNLARMHRLFTDFSIISDAFSRAIKAGAEPTESDWNVYFWSCFRSNQLEQALGVAKRAVELFPENDYFSNHYSYISFLVGERVEEAVRVMRKLYKDNPSNDMFRLTLALGLHRMGKARDALKLVEDSQINFAKEGASDQVLYAAILASNGRSAMASSIAENIDQTRLMPVELELIAGLIETDASQDKQNEGE